MTVTSGAIFAASIARMVELDGGSSATWWRRVRNNEILHFRDGGRTKVVIDFPGAAPPREGRPPTYREYMADQLANPVPAKATPEGARARRGRPRKS
jgi:hypothetical protein